MTALFGALAHFAPWTTADDATLARAYSRGGYKAAMRALPGRSKCAVLHRARQIGCSRRRRWTEADDKALRNLWEDGGTLRRIAATLGRTKAATYWRAQKIGLPLGLPQGAEYLSTAAARAGYTPRQLRNILEWAGKRARLTLARPIPSKTHRRFHYVDPLDVEDAIEAWIATEPVTAAARRIGVDDETLRDRLRMVGIVGAGGKRHLRVTEAQVTKAMALGPVVRGGWAIRQVAA